MEMVEPEVIEYTDKQAASRMFFLGLLVGVIIVTAAIIIIAGPAKMSGTIKNTVQNKIMTVGDKTLELLPPVMNISPTPTASLPEMWLTITSPANGTTVSSPSVTVKGTTTALAEVFINDLAIKADKTGYFTATVVLDEGANYLLIVANDENGQNSETELIVNYEPQ